MRQHALVPSGCQQWVHNPVTVSADGDFAYSSALAVYVYGADSRGAGNVTLRKILARVSHSVTSISWSPHDANLIAMACSDLSLKIVALDTEKEVAVGSSKVGSKTAPPLIHWALHEPKSVFIHAGNGLILWDSVAGKSHSIRIKGSSITAFAQSRADPGKIAIGYDDGMVYVMDMNTKKGTEFPQMDSRVTSLAFDPLSRDYLIGASWSGQTRMWLLGEAADAPGTAFSKQPTGYRTLAFISTMPGTFLSVTDRSGVIQMWNVSRPEPMKRLKAGLAGLQSVTPIHDSPKAIITVKDGTVMLYNVERARAEWQTQGGHTETIFGCQFHPENPNLLATCSYDSTVRLWDITTQQAVKTFVGGQGVLYSVSWSPDGAHLAASSSNGSCYIFDANKGSLVKSMPHHRAASYRVEWHPTEGNLLACASVDKNVVVFRIDGTVTRSLPHPKGACSVSWCPHEKFVLATTCENSMVYVWDVSNSNPRVLHQLEGHGARTFNVVWNPILTNVLMSGADDGTLRVWHLDSGTSTELKGHTSKVRGLLWHSEMPNVAISGSWDSSIRVWDTTNGECLQVVRDHHADVYGIAAHRRRPFALATTSRDTTLRIWDLRSTFPSVQLKAACGVSVRGTPSPVSKPGELCGTASAAVEASMAGGGSPLNRFAALFGLLGPPGAVAELWDLAAAVAASTQRGAGKQHVPAVRDPQTPHQGSVATVLNHKAQELEMRKNIKARGIGAAKREDVLREAAAAHLLAGNFESYCELCIELGAWADALMAAPAVGVAYWQGLMARRAERLIEEGAAEEELKPYFIASGQAPKLVERLIAFKAHGEAFQVATVHADGGYSAAGSAVGVLGGSGLTMPPLRARSSGLASLESAMDSASLDASTTSPAAVRQLQAAALLKDAQPTAAACCHLSVNDVKGALDKLWRGHEVVLAACLASALDSPLRPFYMQALARACEVNGEWQLGGQVLRELGASEALELLAARVAAQNTGRADSILSALGLKSQASYAQMAGSASDAAHAARCHLLAGNQEGGAKAVLGALRDALRGGPAPVAQPLRDVLMSVSAESLSDALRSEVLAYACYLGVVKAMEEGYASIVPCLFKLLRQLLGSASFEFPVSTAVLGKQEAGFKAQDGLEVRIQGSNIPSGASREAGLISCVSGVHIQGPYVVLEDGSSRMSMSEAVMLSHVMSFSPLCTGKWLMV